VPTSASAGAIPFTNAMSGQKTFFGGASMKSDVACTLLMYDRIFAVAKTMASTTAEAVTGVPTRYTSTTPLAEDYAAGNFLLPEIGTTLAAQSHNWTVCQYTNQAGTTGQSLPSFVGINGAAANTSDLTPTQQWFAPLAAGDTGIKALTQMQCDASIATGAIDFVIGHPIAWVPCYLANITSIVDGVVGPFNFARVFDDACLSFLVPASGSAVTVIGNVTLVQG
jgi:hypothetical protein